MELIEMCRHQCLHVGSSESIRFSPKGKSRNCSAAGLSINRTSRERPGIKRRFSVISPLCSVDPRSDACVTR